MEDDLEHLENFQRITFLTIGHNTISTRFQSYLIPANKLSLCPKLQNITLTCVKLDLSGMDNMNSFKLLESLYLEKVKFVSTCSECQQDPIQLSSLKEIEFHSFENAKLIMSLQAPCLTTLVINKCPELDSDLFNVICLDWLPNFPRLTSLSLKDCQICVFESLHAKVLSAFG